MEPALFPEGNNFPEVHPFRNFHDHKDNAHHMFKTNRFRQASFDFIPINLPDDVINVVASILGFEVCEPGDGVTAFRPLYVPKAGNLIEQPLDFIDLCRPTLPILTLGTKEMGKFTIREYRRGCNLPEVGVIGREVRASNCRAFFNMPISIIVNEVRYGPLGNSLALILDRHGYLTIPNGYPCFRDSKSLVSADFPVLYNDCYAPTPVKLPSRPRGRNHPTVGHYPGNCSVMRAPNERLLPQCQRLYSLESISLLQMVDDAKAMGYNVTIHYSAPWYAMGKGVSAEMDRELEVRGRFSASEDGSHIFGFTSCFGRVPLTFYCTENEVISVEFHELIALNFDFVPYGESSLFHLAE